MRSTETPTALEMVGKRVKVWYDRGARALLIEDHTSHRVRDIYGVCLEDVEFEVEATPRGGSRCYAKGILLADPNTCESTKLKTEIRREAGGGLDFYWSRDKRWPVAGARRALIAPPHGGFATCSVIDPR
ncbi:hypothetical protein [Sphingomonas sp. 3-13AW]|uniref:hypothetical protein n=1 Tax=Sphingomonas sp. 3-13AW TaxID=3050450 RepID=UPI003BB49A04